MKCAHLLYPYAIVFTQHSSSRTYRFIDHFASAMEMATTTSWNKTIPIPTYIVYNAIPVLKPILFRSQSSVMVHQVLAPLVSRLIEELCTMKNWSVYQTIQIGHGVNSLFG